MFYIYITKYDTIILFISKDNLVVLHQVSRPLYVQDYLWVGGWQSRWYIGRVAISSVADFLGNILANSDWNLLVLGRAVLARDVLALLQRLVGTDLVWNLSALLSGHVLALLLRHVTTHGVGNLPLLRLLHVLALVVGVLPAGPGDGSPDLVVALTLPLVLAVVLVLCGALRLSVGLVLRLVLVNTDALVDGLAALLIDSAALLSGGGLTQPLIDRVTHLLVVSDALLGLLLLVLSVPHRGVLCPALD